jgi:hypothetical protein
MEQELQLHYFVSPNELRTFVNTSGLVGSVISITFDSGSGQWALWFLPP